MWKSTELWSSPGEAESPRPVLVITGMAREAQIARGPGTDVVLSGGDTHRLAARLRDLRPRACSAVLSFGIAGGLDPALRPGAVIVASRIVSGERSWSGSPGSADNVAERLRGGLPSSTGIIAGSDVPLVDAYAKQALFRASGALAVDMESHVAAAYAAEHGLPFAAIRVVCDPAQRSLPLLAVQALRPDGGTDLGLVLRGLARRPGLLPAMLRLGRDADAAFRSLRRCGDLLGIGRGGADLVELLGDVA